MRGILVHARLRRSDASPLVRAPHHCYESRQRIRELTLYAKQVLKDHYKKPPAPDQRR